LKENRKKIKKIWIALNQIRKYIKLILKKILSVILDFLKFIKSNFGLFGFIISLFALFFSIYTFRNPKINIDHSISFDTKDAFKTPFIISNLGNSTIMNVSLIIKIDSSYAATKISQDRIIVSSIIDTQKIKNINPGRRKYFFVNLYDYIKKRSWSNEFSLGFGPGYPSDLKVKKTEIEFSLSYTWSCVFNLTKKESFKFVSIEDKKNEIHWLPLHH